MKNNLEHKKEYYKKNKIRVREYQKQWYLKNKEKVLLSKKEYALKNPRYQYSTLIKREYGLSLEDYDKMILSQSGSCLICGANCENKRNLSVDHCHKTGKVRGLLCIGCNRGLGAFKDNINHLKEAIQYLNDSR